MYIRKSTRTYKEKTYTNHLLVESIQTPKGPRQRIICSLGSLEPGPAEEWLGLAHKLESALEGQESLPDSSEQIQGWVEKARRKKRGTSPRGKDHSGSSITVEAVPGYGYVFSTRKSDGVHYGAVRVAYIAANYVVFDWSYQSAMGNVELSRVPVTP